MELDSDDQALRRIAAGDKVPDGTWVDLRQDILARLDSIAHNDFPLPKFPRSASKLSLSQESDKENVPEPESQPEPAPAPEPAPGQLPGPIDDFLTAIKKHLDETFRVHGPHTMQRLAELLLEPRAHYKTLTSYLHAVDRVVRVTSGTNIFPLPPAVPNLRLNGDAGAAAAVAWSNPTSAALGTDEALGGALLTPIPWLTRSSPDDEGSDADSTPATAAAGAAGAQIHSEGTETIDGPNGVGSIETVSVSVNGIPSTGHARGVTQGELLRQEQRAGVVPVSQLARAHNQELELANHSASGQQMEGDAAVDDEIPHARGPPEIGIDDTGPQSTTTSYMSNEGLLTRHIDVEAAVGRKHEDDASPDIRAKDEDAAGTESAGIKREATVEQTDQPTKKIKEEADVVDDKEEAKSEAAAAAAAPGDKDNVTAKTEDAA